MKILTTEREEYTTAVKLTHHPSSRHSTADAIGGLMAMLHFRMAALFESVTDLNANADALRRRRHGVIDVYNGRLTAIHLRPWPKWVSLAGVVWGNWSHRYVRGDRMRLYYDQPHRCPNFLSLKFALSARDTTLKTALVALQALDEVARIQSSDALLLDAANFRLSPRMLARFGWQLHAPSRWHRNYIKRFYPEGSGFRMEEWKRCSLRVSPSPS